MHEDYFLVLSVWWYNASYTWMHIFLDRFYWECFLWLQSECFSFFYAHNLQILYFCFVPEVPYVPFTLSYQCLYHCLNVPTHCPVFKPWLLSSSWYFTQNLVFYLFYWPFDFYHSGFLPHYQILCSVSYSDIFMSFSVFLLFESIQKCLSSLISLNTVHSHTFGFYWFILYHWILSLNYWFTDSCLCKVSNLFIYFKLCFKLFFENFIWIQWILIIFTFCYSMF